MDPNACARSRATASARSSAVAVAREWALPIAIGAVALLLDQLIRIPIQLPGHNGVLWMGGLIAARLVSANGLGASAAGVGGMIAAQRSDPLAGLEIAVAGLLLDVLVAARRLPQWLWLPIIGAIANAAVLAMKLSTDSAPHAVATRGVGLAVASFVLYGAIGGALAGAGSALARGLTRRDGSRAIGIEHP